MRWMVLCLVGLSGCTTQDVRMPVASLQSIRAADEECVRLVEYAEELCSEVQRMSLRMEDIRAGIGDDALAARGDLRNQQTILNRFQHALDDYIRLKSAEYEHLAKPMQTDPRMSVVETPETSTPASGP